MITTYPSHPVCQHVGCESDGRIIPGYPPLLRCKRCQRQFSEWDDLDGGHTTENGVPVPTPPPENHYPASILNKMNLVSLVPGRGAVPVEFR